MDQIVEYRAWDNIRKKMYDVLIIDFNSFLTVSVADDKDGYLWLVDFKLMQYTGLKAKGIKVFDGDVVISSEVGGVVFFNNFEFKIESKRFMSPLHDFDRNIKDHGEVIGNIYANPELDKMGFDKCLK